MSGQKAFKGNSGALTLSYSYNNIITSNIMENNDVGCWLSYGSPEGNTIVSNIFLNNSQQCVAEAPTLTNTWDGGYPFGGNYWDDHAGPDLCSGRFQNETGSDGIVDTPYVMNAANQDRYPLASPPPCIHALAIDKVNVASFVEQGSTVNVSAEIANQGHFPETTDITISANATQLIRLEKVTLASKESCTVTMQWNTTGLDIGTYIVTVTATSADGEQYLGDNALSASVLVGIQGDVDHSGQVNLLDLWLVASHFNAHIGEPAYVADYDANHDGTINMLDLWTCATKFGTTAK
jgi:hypothetical protein